MVVRYLSLSIMCVIIVAAVLRVSHDFYDIFRVHMAIAALLSLSGILISTIPEAKYVYVATGCLSWYGVFYSYVSSESQLMWHHYFRPEIFVAFLSFAGSLLTIPELDDAKKLIMHPIMNTSGLACLLAYFWIVELYFVKEDHDFFVDSVMHKMPHRLTDISTEWDHKMLYSLILIVSHYSSVLLMWMMSVDGGGGQNIPGTTPEVDDSNKLMEIIQQRVSSRKRNTEENSHGIASSQPKSSALNGDNLNGDTLNSDNSKNTKTATSTPPYVNRSDQNEQSELPSDCLEISFDDAIYLTGCVEDDCSDPTDSHPGAV